MNAGWVHIIAHFSVERCYEKLLTKTVAASVEQLADLHQVMEDFSKL